MNTFIWMCGTLLCLIFISECEFYVFLAKSTCYYHTARPRVEYDVRITNVVVFFRRIYFKLVSTFAEALKYFVRLCMNLLCMVGSVKRSLFHLGAHKKFQLLIKYAKWKYPWLLAHKYSVWKRQTRWWFIIITD